MWENKLNNFNIDLLAKDPTSFSKSHKTIKIEFIRIESNLDLKKIRSSGNTLLNLKRNRYKLMRLFGQSPQFILAKKSVAEWQLRKDMPIGNLITLRGNTPMAALDRFYKLLFLIGIPRDSKLLVNSIKQKKVSLGLSSINKFGLNELNSESIIIENDWTMSNFIENSWNKSISTDLDKQMNEVRELKLLNIGMSINIKLNLSDLESKSKKFNTVKHTPTGGHHGNNLNTTTKESLFHGNKIKYNNWLISYLPMYF